MSGSAAYGVTMLSGGFGYVSDNRIFKPDRSLDKFWDKSHLEYKETPLIQVGARLGGNKLTTLATQEEMHKIVLKTLHQTKAIAKKLEGRNLRETLRNIAHYLQYNFRYKQDASDREQIRTPIRSFQDRYIGIDCDCFSTLASSILTNLGIDHYWRKTKPSASDPDYAHIYVIVPKMPGLDLNIRSNYYVIDPVVTYKPFDYEHTDNDVPPYKHDYHVSRSMNGMGALLTVQPLQMFKGNIKKTFLGLGIVAFVIAGGIIIYQNKKSK